MKKDSVSQVMEYISLSHFVTVAGIVRIYVQNFIKQY